MNILIVSQYFWPENFLINNLALGLLQRGHHVTVLTGSPNYPSGKFFDGYGYFNRQENYHGVNVLRVPLLPRGRGGGSRLALNFLSFALSASILGPLICRGRFDRIFVFEPSPITVGVPAIILKLCKSAPLLFWVQDLWPESLLATGAVKSRPVLAMIDALVKYIYRNCDLILVQSRAFFDSIVAHGGDTGAIEYFPNSAEKVFDNPAAPAEHPPLLPHGFRLMFAGNIGAAQDFPTIIAAAEKLRHLTAIHWLIVGDGRMREWAEEEVRNRGLCGQFHFLGSHPIDAMPAFFSSADAMLVTLRKEPIFALTIPSKVQAYLACGKPVIAALDGEGAQVIIDSGAGFACPGEDPDAFSRVVLKMYETAPAERAEMGMRGRAYYEANFDSDMLLDRLENWMLQLPARQGGDNR